MEYSVLKGKYCQKSKQIHLELTYFPRNFIFDQRLYKSTDFYDNLVRKIKKIQNSAIGCDFRPIVRNRTLALYQMPCLDNVSASGQRFYIVRVLLLNQKHLNPMYSSA